MRTPDMVLRWTCFFTLVIAASCQLLSSTRLLDNELSIQEITQIMNDADPSGKNHSIRVITGDHKPLYNITEWNFLLHCLEEGKFISYDIKSDGENPTYQTEFVFDGNLVDSNSFLLLAKNGTDDVAMDYKVLGLEGLKSKVSWVGENREMQSSTLRVFTDSRMDEILVNQSSCTPSNSPCYHITPERKPSSIARCVNISVDDDSYIRLCDERVASFKEMHAKPNITLRDDRSLQLDFAFHGKNLDVEVVVYDPEDHKNVFSRHPYKCKFLVGKMWEEGETMPCRPDLIMPEDQTDMMVLVSIINDENEVMESTLQYFDTTANRKLSIEKISKVMSEDDPTGRNHNVKLEISHKMLSNIKQWKLAFHKNGEFKTYDVESDGSDPLTQREIIFEGNLLDADAIALSAFNSSNNLVAIDYIVLDILDMNSDVAWVGDERENLDASLRVWTGQNIDEIDLGFAQCRRDESPCYYVTPNSKPTSVERCIEKTIGKNRVMQLCDDRVADFTETSPLPTATINEEGNLEVELAVQDGEQFRAEVVAYDSQYPNKVYSDSGYHCYSPTGVEPYNGERMACSQDLSLPEGKERFAILIVKHDEEGRVITSSLLHYGNNDGGRQKQDIGVIIGAVLGSIIGVAILAFLIIFLMKRRKTENVSRSKHSYKYKTTSKDDRKESYVEKQAEDGGNSSD